MEKLKIYSNEKYDFKNERMTTTNTVYPIGTKIVDVYDKGTEIYRGTIPTNRIKKEF